MLSELQFTSYNLNTIILTRQNFLRRKNNRDRPIFRSRIYVPKFYPFCSMIMCFYDNVHLIWSQMDVL